MVRDTLGTLAQPRRGKVTFVAATKVVAVGASSVRREHGGDDMNKAVSVGWVVIAALGFVAGPSMAQRASRAVIVSEPAVKVAPAALGVVNVSADSVSLDRVAEVPVLLASTSRQGRPPNPNPIPIPIPIPIGGGCLGNQGGGTSRC